MAVTRVHWPEPWPEVNADVVDRIHRDVEAAFGLGYIDKDHLKRTICSVAQTPSVEIEQIMADLVHTNAGIYSPMPETYFEIATETGAKDELEDNAGVKAHPDFGRF